jgi:hypothetical protein
MKKYIFLAGMFCTVTGVLYAQSALKDTRKFGSWIHTDGKLSTFSHFVPSPTIPGTIQDKVDGPWTPTPATRQKMQAILNLFIAACPRPRYLSHTYGVRGTLPFSEVMKNHSYHLHIGEAHFLYDKAGMVEPIKSGKQVANMYDGVIDIYVNHVPRREGAYGISRGQMNSAFKYAHSLSFPKNSNKSRSNGLVYQIPPQNNFVEASELPNETSFDVLKLHKIPEGILKLQHLKIWNRYQEKETIYALENFVFISKNNKLPFVALTRKDFLNLLEISKDEEMESFRKNIVLSSDYKEQKTHYDKLEAKFIQEYQEDKQALQQIREYWKDSLQEPAIIHQEHVALIKGTVWGYRNSQPARERKKIAEIFVSDSNKGTSLVQYQKNFYEGIKDGEVRSIILQWEENYRPERNENHGKLKPEPEPTKNTDTPGHLRYAMRHTFDWSNLAGLSKAK